MFANERQKVHGSGWDRGRKELEEQNHDHDILCALKKLFSVRKRKK